MESNERHRIADSLRDLYQLLASSVIDHTSALKVSWSTGGGKVLIVADGHPLDYGRLLGQGARMFKACESILRSSLFARDIAVDLIVDAPREEMKHFSKFRPMVNWSEDDDKRIAQLLRSVAIAVWKGPTVIHRSISHSASSFTLKPNEPVCHRPSCTMLIEESFQIWFDAVGRTRGRIVYLDVI